MEHCTTIKFQPSIPQLALDSSLASVLHLTTIDDEGVAGFTRWLLNQSGETHHLGFLISLLKRKETRDLLSGPFTVQESVEISFAFLCWSKTMFFFSG